MEMTSLEIGEEWFQLISSVNRLILSYESNSALVRKANVSRWLVSSGAEAENSWKIALCALGAECAHQAIRNSNDLAALEKRFDRNIDSLGNWKTPIDKVDHAMMGYSLLYLAKETDAPRYRKAADQLVELLLVEYPRVSDGSLPYNLGSGEVLVDTLGMICPFLARYSNQYGNLEALRLSLGQLQQFILNNVDTDTHLPYHGYYSDGPKRLGAHGWGRGTGWYMLGLIDTIVEMPKGHPDRSMLLEAYRAAANSLRIFQRGDGHWNWAILHREDMFDSSTTSMVGYSLLRGVQAGILDQSYRPVILSALSALVYSTRSDGLLQGSLAECRGIGKYPQSYGPQIWLQGSATAFGALYIADLSGMEQ